MENVTFNSRRYNLPSPTSYGGLEVIVLFCFEKPTKERFTDYQVAYADLSLLLTLARLIHLLLLLTIDGSKRLPTSPLYSQYCTSALDSHI